MPPEQRQEQGQRLLWPSNRHLFSPQTPKIVDPRNRAGQARLTIRPYVAGHARLAPPAVCAIPLIDVVPKSGFNPDPKMVIPAPEQTANIDHMPVSSGLPPCPQGER
jgi:hypothetical protein